jgi:hypothetical protein
MAKAATKFKSFATSEAPLSDSAIKRGLEMVKTKKGALKLLQGAGILDKKGNLSKPYRAA